MFSAFNRRACSSCFTILVTSERVIVIEHSTEALEGINIVAFQAVPIVFLNHGIELSGHTAEAGADVALLDFLSDEPAPSLGH